MSFHEKAVSFLEVPAFESSAILLFEGESEAMVGLFIGPYKIERQLGVGGMGEVYLAEDTKLERKVAIKILPVDLQLNELARKRLLREARAAAKLDHPNICSIYEVAEAASHSFIVMQYVEGKTLASRLQRKPLKLSESLDVAVQVADALSEAHSQGIIHRDIKPDNIMLTSRGQVKVLDFGLAKVVRSIEAGQAEAQPQSLLSAPGVIVGTAPYMSPEQAKGAPVDSRSDLFSLGVMLYECIAGRLPFSGATPMEVCAQVIHLDPPPPSRFNSNVPPELDAVSLKALAKEPKARYQTAGDLLEDLRAVSAVLRVEDQVATRHTPIKLGTYSVRGLSTLSNALRRPRILIPAVIVALLLAWMVYKEALRVAPHQPSQVALYWYNEGIIDLRDGAYYKANKKLGQAVTVDNEFALAHARLAETCIELDQIDEAKDEIIIANSLVSDRSMLPPLESLYLQAVTNTVKRDLAGAIASYHEIVRQSPDTEKPFAYLDLARAYENNDEIEKAIESYEEAARRAPQLAAAFLRLGILYVQRRDFANAETAFQKAEKLYEILSNPEGVAEVLYYRSRLSNSSEQLAEARRSLEHALALLENTDNIYQQIRMLLHLGRVYLLQGNTTLAKEYATRAINLAQANDRENLTTRGLVNLGDAFFRQYNYPEAENYFKQALVFAQKNKGRRNEAMARLALGIFYIQQHKEDVGKPYIEQALEFYQNGGYRREASRALKQYGEIYAIQGDYPNAIHTFKEHLEVAQELGDMSLVADSHLDIGFVLADQEQYSEALRHFNNSYEIYESMGDEVAMANNLVARADMLWRLGRYLEAQAALNMASSKAERLDERNEYLRARIPLIKASLALSERQFAEAKAKGLEALDSNAEGEHASEAMYTLGLAKVLSGARSEGRLLCEKAVVMAADARYSRLLPCAQLALAEAQLITGDSQAALSTVLQAQPSFAKAGQQESEWRAWLIASRACKRKGDNTTARDYASLANGLLSNLQQKWGPEAYNDYLKRPDVQELLKYLNQLLAEASRFTDNFERSS